MVRGSFVVGGTYDPLVLDDDIQTRHPAWPWANVSIEQRAYAALILRWERRANSQGYYAWSARVTYLDGDEHKEALIPAARVKRVG